MKVSDLEARKLDREPIQSPFALRLGFLPSTFFPLPYTSLTLAFKPSSLHAFQPFTFNRIPVY